MSGQFVPVLTLSVAATTAITAEHFVTTAGAPAGAGVTALGVARSDGAIGRQVPVDALGTAIVIAGAAFAAGAALESDANGAAITNTTGVKLARALQAATAAGDRVEVLLIPN